MDTAVTTSLLTHLITVGGFFLACFAIARLISEKRQPSNTVAWLLAIGLIPYIGVPAYLLFAGRKLRRLADRKARLAPTAYPFPQIALPAGAAKIAQTITSAGGAEPVGGNRTSLLTTGEASYAELVQCIQQAQHSIHITTFILGRDATGRALVELLAARAQEGVQVCLLLDALGCFLAKGSFVEPIRRAGGLVRSFMPVVPLAPKWSANLRNHRKLALFDRQTAIIGGQNLAMEYVGLTPHPKRFRDLGMRIDGPAVVAFEQVFAADWKFSGGPDLTEESPASGPQGDVILQPVASGPDVAGEPLYDGILTAIQEARERVWIATPYFIPDEVLQRTLTVKARAGHDVRLILPRKSNHALPDFARRHYLRELMRAGVQVMLYQPGMLHAKGLVVDDEVGIVGSANFDLRSLFVNFEINVLVYSREETGHLATWMENVMENCVRLQPDAKPQSRLSSIAEDFSRLLAPLL